MKKTIRFLLDLLPNIISKSIFSVLFYIKNHKLIDAKNDYNFSDEKLKFVHLLEGVNYIKSSIPLGVPPVFLEFGCHSGRTFSSIINAAKYLNISNTEFFAFDSFEGLPETNKNEDGIFETGTFHTTKSNFKKIIKKKTGVKLDDKNIISGFYSNSLTIDLQKKMPKIGMVHIDVDLYSSTIQVLDFIKPLIVKGTLLVFDDWYCFPPNSGKGEPGAVQDFIKKNPGFRIEEWKSYSTYGKSFFVVRVP